MPTRKQTTIYYLYKKNRAIYFQVQQGMSSHFAIVHSSGPGSGRKSFELWLYVYQFFHTKCYRKLQSAVCEL